MSLLDLFRRRERGSSRLAAWREQWRRAADLPSTSLARELRLALEAAVEPDEDSEVEWEMQEGLETAAALAEAPPAPIVTGHRVVGTDACYFSAPACLPDEPSQPTGTLLLTSSRAVFVGGARAVSAPWHAVARCTAVERDLVLVTRDERLHRIRCNTYGDALSAAVLGRRLAAAAYNRAS